MVGDYTLLSHTYRCIGSALSLLENIGDPVINVIVLGAGMLIITEQHDTGILLRN